MSRSRQLTFLILLLLVAGALFAQISLPDSVRPGEPLMVWVNGRKEVVVRVTGESGVVAGPTASFVIAPSPSVALNCAILGVAPTVAPGVYLLEVSSTAGELLERRPIVIAQREFRREEIALSVTMSELRESDDPQKTVEALEVQAIVGEFNREAIYHPGPFQWPIPLTRRTALYGDRRTYLYADGATDWSIHRGTDLAAPTGTPVAASGRGRVRLARTRIVTGESVVIEHLPGVFSLYYHLDRIDVVEGQMVEAGELIGVSGASGLATGPHLHWEFRIGGVWVDPESMLNQPLVDFGP